MEMLKRDHIQNQSKLLAVQEQLINKKSEHLDVVNVKFNSTADDWRAGLTWHRRKISRKSSQVLAMRKKLRHVVKSAIQDNDRVRN